jgi:Fe2+ or Zn2+ uptake regulation protein
MVTRIQKKNTCHHELTLDAITDILQLHKISKTKIKMKLLEIFSKAHHPLSVLEVYQILGKNLCNLSTVFRAINQFKNKQILQEVDLHEGFYRYEMSHENLETNHHHHIRCTKCGKINSFSGCDLSHLNKVVEKLGFKNIQHHLEFLGICKNCS